MSMSMSDFRLGLFISFAWHSDPDSYTDSHWQPEAALCVQLNAVSVSRRECGCLCVLVRVRVCEWVWVWASVCQTFTCATVIYALPYLI